MLGTLYPWGGKICDRLRPMAHPQRTQARRAKLQAWGQHG